MTVSQKFNFFWLLFIFTNLSALVWFMIDLRFGLPDQFQLEIADLTTALGFQHYTLEPLKSPVFKSIASVVNWTTAAYKKWKELRYKQPVFLSVLNKRWLNTWIILAQFNTCLLVYMWKKQGIPQCSRCPWSLITQWPSIKLHPSIVY